MVLDTVTECTFIERPFSPHSLAGLYSCFSILWLYSWVFYNKDVYRHIFYCNQCQPVVKTK